MDKPGPFSFENDELELSVVDSIAVMKFKSHIFEQLTNIEKSSNILSLCDWVERDPVVKVLLILNAADALGETAYSNFMNMVFNIDSNGIELEGDSKLDTRRRMIRARQMNSLRNFITKMVEYKKIYISGIRGCIVTPFFGTSLCADFRFASEDMYVSLAHKKYSLHPSGALPYFLPKFIGESKTVEILLQYDTINADECLRMGLVNELFSDDVFEEKCIEKARELSKLNPVVVRLTKRLIGSYREELAHYFELESKLIGF